VPAQVPHEQPQVAELDDVAVRQPPVHGDGQGVRVQRPRGRGRAGRRDDGRQRTDVVGVAVGRDDEVEAALGVAGLHQREQAGGVGGRVDEQLRAGAAARQEVGHVVGRADVDLPQLVVVGAGDEVGHGPSRAL